MEVIVEIVLQVFAWLFELFGELLLQLIVELIAEVASHLVARKPVQPDLVTRVQPAGPGFVQRWRNGEPVEPWLAMVGYAVFGAVMGLASLWVMPHSFIVSMPLRVANLLFTPICSGMMMALIGSWRARRNQALVRLNKFTYGFCFAFAMSLVRFYLAS